MHKQMTKGQWQNVLRTMEFYKRNSGYVDLVNTKLTFFDSDPCLNDVSGMYVTIEQVKKIILEYDCDIKDINKEI